MGNITDLPVVLISPDCAIEFLEYIDKLPITNRRKVQLITEYTESTDVKISPDQARYYNIDFNV